MKKIIIILICIFLTSLTFPMSLFNAWEKSLAITNEILDNDFWTDEMHIKCTEYRAFYKPANKTYYVKITFELTNMMKDHNLKRFKIRLLDYDNAVSTLVDYPEAVRVDECAMDGNYLCFYYENSIVIIPGETREFTIVGVINHSNFDVVHSRLCFHAMQRWWLRATPVCFDMKFRKEKVLPKNTEIIDQVEDTSAWDNL